MTLVSAGADDGSAMRERASAPAAGDLHGATHDAMARRIRALGIDILVDIGATDGTLLPVLAAQPRRCS